MNFERLTFVFFAFFFASWLLAGYGDDQEKFSMVRGWSTAAIVTCWVIMAAVSVLIIRCATPSFKEQQETLKAMDRDLDYRDRELDYRDRELRDRERKLGDDRRNLEADLRRFRNRVVETPLRGGH